MRKTEVRKFILQLFLILVVLFGISGLYYWKIVKDNRQYYLQVYAQVVNSLVEKHPELEQELVEIISNASTNVDRTLLEKYGINEEDPSYLPEFQNLEKKEWTTFSICLGIGFVVLLIFYLIRLLLFYRQLDRLNQYITGILCGREGTKPTDYKEGTFSILKNDIYKITWELMENKASLKKDKKYLEETLSDISHQLKTPLTSMYMINDLLEKDHLEEKAKQEFLTKNRQQLERIEWLVTALLKLSKLESGTIQLKRESVNAKHLIEESVAPQRIPMELKNQELVIDVARDLTVACDFNWTREALVNIIKNAQEHTPENGQIKIKVTDNPIYVEILITDTGEGIAEEDIHHIFERFYKGKRNSKESIGIGLHMAKNIIDRQYGNIDVTSKKGLGTTFQIKLYKGK